ncbi:undecaprenyl-phosphate glucose phosphotransferase [Piscinibacter sakaiensis]|uniref:Glycosyltransferase n=1 Tax=Piscinibacter sakaiensis TaxID=1547922 RepID=A0A0K8P306_PISS1|nr:undecaprenyl-phosphate glucose phosphotransferase [Piscinibacter sakaiensis]GAP37052.1 glycosyltransferase [Piscinibacter sakaiensis]
MATGKLREGNSLLSAGIVALDAACVWLAGLLLHRHAQGSWELGSEVASTLMAASVLMVMASTAVYRSFRGGAIFAMLGRVSLAWSLVWFALVFWLLLIGVAVDTSRTLLALWGAGTLALLLVARVLCVIFLRWLRSRGYSERRVLLVGDGPLTAELRRRIGHATWTGYRIEHTLHVDQLERLRALSDRGGFHEVWLNLGIEKMHRMPEVLAALHQSTADIRMVPDVFTYRMANHGTSSIAGVPMVDISASPIAGVNALVKRVEDYLLASVILVLISPVLLLIALAVKLTSPGPVIYKQRRHGWNGETIVVYKFRSMKIHQEAAGRVTQATRNDPRLTSIGGFLRRTSLDELPQFINVLQGRMSIVGPRPHALEHNDHYKQLIPHYMLRHKMKPGITGWAQINGYRGETETVDKMKARVEHDLHYLERWSLWLDLRIVLMTVVKGFGGRHVY